MSPNKEATTADFQKSPGEGVGGACKIGQAQVYGECNTAHGSIKNVASNKGATSADFEISGFEPDTAKLKMNSKTQ